ncbi:hypothetical protein M422DRAFT_42312 [Sphaerobolus stellatus SS14]|nr:hypothetical protein M422DRAFT_42312 [Sphaerobolus stellatus SS14]
MLPSPVHRRKHWRRTTPPLVLILKILFALGIFAGLALYYFEVKARLNALLHLRKPLRTRGRLKGPLPTYKEILEFQNDLRRWPQHDLNLSFSEGGERRYVKFSTHPREVELNDWLDDVFLSAHIAWRTKRGYVFQDYEWPPQQYPWSILPWPTPSTPITAIVAGPVEGFFEEEVQAPVPRAIHPNWFDKVCTKERTRVIVADKIREVRNNARDVVDSWVRLLKDVKEDCVHVVPGKKRKSLLDKRLFSSPLMHPLWHELKNSPMYRFLEPSPLVQSAIYLNEHLFFTGKTIYNPSRYDSILAVHVPPTGFQTTCNSIAASNTSLYMWNSLPELPDRLKRASFSPGAKNPNTLGPETLIQKRCYPSIENMVAKIMTAKSTWESSPESEGHKLKTVYLLAEMGSDERPRVEELRARLGMTGWKAIVSAEDFEMNAEQMSVGGAVDVEIGRRAGLFVGNGWTSLSSGIVQRRLIDGKAPLSIRFW